MQGWPPQSWERVVADQITAADIDRAAALIGIQATPWQRDTLLAAYGHHKRTGRWPVLVIPRRSARTAISRINVALLGQD